LLGEEATGVTRGIKYGKLMEGKEWSLVIKHSPVSVVNANPVWHQWLVGNIFVHYPAGLGDLRVCRKKRPRLILEKSQVCARGFLLFD
jgi:hypothetical protein